MGPWDTGGFYGIESPAMKKLTPAAGPARPPPLRPIPGRQHRARARHHQPRRIRHRNAAGSRAADRGKFPGLRARRRLYATRCSIASIANFVIQGGGVGHRVQGRAHAEADRERSRQRPQESARHRGPRARQRSALGRSPVLRQRRRQRRSRSPAHALGLRRVRPRRRRHGSRGSHQRVAHRRDGAFQAGCADAGGDHPEDRAVDRWRDACGQASSRGRADGNTAGGAGCGARNATGDTPATPPAKPPGEPASESPPPK